MDWPKDPQVWQRLAPFLDQIEEIYLTGGEPFLSLEQVHLLSDLVETGRSSQVCLKYNTNLTLIPPRLVKLWPHFKTVRLNVSIDGTGELLNYIRYPAEWEPIANNLDQLFLLKKECPNIEIGVHVTVQMYNIIGLDKLIEVFLSRWGVTPYLNILNHPHCLNIRVLPASLRTKVVNQLQDLAKKINSVQEIIDYMLAEDWSDNYLKEFVAYTKRLDELREQSLLTLQPDFQYLWDQDLNSPGGGEPR
jgi:sulfatase maturation enzyme AslB (radical SAM superfamily)